MPDAARAESASPELIPEEGSPPDFEHRPISFRHLSDGSLALASLTTTAFDRSSSRWLEINDLIVKPEGPPSSPV